jgi:KaiC/GvpD/RAD55 family RecA-like ATPase
VGFERFENADVQANLVASQEALKIGENLDLDIELVNAGKGSASLVKLADVTPEGFELIQKPDVYGVEDNYINMKGKRLDPLKTEEVRLVLKPKVQGVFPLKPRVLYIDENGKYKSYGPEPVTITVEELRVTEVSPQKLRHVVPWQASLDRLLGGGIPENFAVALTAPACEERESLVRNYLDTGVRKGEVTFYLTVNPDGAKPLAEAFRSNFYLFICGPYADPVVDGLPNVVKLNGVGNLTNISIALTSAIRRINPQSRGHRRACLDLISDVLLQHHAVQTRRWLTALTTELKSAGFTTLAVVDPQMHSPEELYTILALFQGEINLYEKETGKGSEKYVRIKRMSDQKYVENELPLREEDLPKKK